MLALVVSFAFLGDSNALSKDLRRQQILNIVIYQKYTLESNVCQDSLTLLKFESAQFLVFQHCCNVDCIHKSSLLQKGLFVVLPGGRNTGYSAASISFPSPLLKTEVVEKKHFITFLQRDGGGKRVKLEKVVPVQQLWVIQNNFFFFFLAVQCYPFLNEDNRKPHIDFQGIYQKKKCFYANVSQWQISPVQ